MAHRIRTVLATTLAFAALHVVAATSQPASATAEQLRVATPIAREIHTGLGPASGSPRAWASRTLVRNANRLGVDASLIRWESVRHSLIGTHVRGRAFIDGVPVYGSDVEVSAIHGRVAQITASPVRGTGIPVSGPIRATTARQLATTAAGIRTLLVPASVDRMLMPIEGRLVDSYVVDMIGKVPARPAHVVLDAATGRVLLNGDDAAYDDTTSVTAKIFDPNPLVTARDTSLRSPFETGTGVDIPLDAAELAAQLKTRKLTNLDPSMLQLGILSGTWANIVAPVGYLNLFGGPLSYSRSDPRFVGVMAYAHVNRYQEWLQSLGIKHVNNEAQKLIPTLAQGYDNSFYQPGNDIIVYGGGGVPDAEDAEVILHEYGHAMQDAQVPGYGATKQGGSMGEGFGDFNADNYYALTSRGFNDLCAAEWDATSYSTTDPPCLRRLDSTKRYPADVAGEVHADGEMWSAFLWRLRSHLGSSTRAKSVNAIRLVTSMHELLTPAAKYANAVSGLITAAKALKHPEWVKFIKAEAKRTGYPVKTSKG